MQSSILGCYVAFIFSNFVEYGNHQGCYNGNDVAINLGTKSRSSCKSSCYAQSYPWAMIRGSECACAYTIQNSPTIEGMANENCTMPCEHANDVGGLCGGPDDLWSVYVTWGMWLSLPLSVSLSLFLTHTLSVTHTLSLTHTPNQHRNNKYTKIITQVNVAQTSM